MPERGDREAVVVNLASGPAAPREAVRWIDPD